MLYDVEIRRTKVDPHFCIMVMPPERVKVAQFTKTTQVSRDCPYFEYWDFPTISELRADGYKLDGKDLPDDLGSDEGFDDTQEGAARDRYFETDTDHENPLDPAMRRVRCRWVWIRYDYDEDGIAELQYCVIVGRQIIHREEVNRIPVAVLCPNPLPHRHIGLCPADDTGDIQQIATVMLRQGIDNLQFSTPVRSTSTMLWYRVPVASCALGMGPSSGRTSASCRCRTSSRTSLTVSPTSITSARNALA
jgi:hypothetical protein